MFSTQIPLKMPILVKVSPSRQTLQQNMPHMDLEGTMLSEISHPRKTNYYMISFICGILKIQQASELNK